MTNDIEYWHWMYHHFDEVDDGPRLIAEVLWMQCIVVGGMLAVALVA